MSFKDYEVTIKTKDNSINFTMHVFLKYPAKIFKCLDRILYEKCKPHKGTKVLVILKSLDKTTKINTRKFDYLYNPDKIFPKSIHSIES